MAKIAIYDTTLRDGNQAKEISFSLSDKLRIAKRLDSIGVQYIEGGWPNPTNTIDVEFYSEVKKLGLKNAKIAAFGSTMRPGNTPAKDATLQSLVKTKAEVITIFGKSWDLHATDIIKVSLAENLKLINNSVKYLKKKCSEVVYDAEHFFDGFKENPQYAIDTLKAAEDAGADCLVLCDTNGGCLPLEYADIFDTVMNSVKTPLGVHNHNDAGCAVANTIIALEMGATHFQGTINGLGERCGNANLCSIIPSVELKLEEALIGANNLKQLKELSVYVAEISNVTHDFRQPYVGSAAFSHKGGAHIDGVMKVSRSFEHVKPESVGGVREYVLSDQSGGATIVDKLKKQNINLPKTDKKVKNLLKSVKELELKGYQFEAAEASFNLLIQKELEKFNEKFKFLSFRVIEELREDGKLYSEATIKVQSADGEIEHTAADGNGPVSALDHAIRKSLTKFFPELSKVHLVDYKVRVLDAKEGTNAKVRVTIQSSDGKDYWGTIGVSENIIEASWIALLDSLNYKLMLMANKSPKKSRKK